MGKIKQKGGEVNDKCLKIVDKYALEPLRLIKRSPPYQQLNKLAEKNRDYILLAKIVGTVVTIGLIYLIYIWLSGGFQSVNLSLIGNYLQTMSGGELPMSESINVQTELDALNCHRQFFNQSPYSIENTGAYDLVRGVLILPFLIFFIHYILPVVAVIYIVWFLYHYLGYISKAFYGFVVEVVIDYMTKFIVCKISSFIPFFRFKCPNLYDTLTKWRKNYIDKPIYIEKVKYFKFYYDNKRRFYDIPKLKYFDQLWEKGAINADYSDKFLTRSKDIFYQQVMTTQSGINTIADKTKSTISSSSKYIINTDQSNTTDEQQQQKSWQQAETRVKELYSLKGVIGSLMLLIISLGIVYLIVYYNITGKPHFIYQAIAPLYRSSGQKLLSSRYNWLKMISLFIIIVGFLIHTYLSFKWW